MAMSSKATAFIFSLELFILMLFCSSVYAYSRIYVTSPVIVDFLFNAFFYFSLFVFVITILSLTFSKKTETGPFKSVYCTALCQAATTLATVFWVLCLYSELFHVTRIGSTGPSGLLFSAMALGVSFVGTLLLYMISYVSAPEGIHLAVLLSGPFCSALAYFTMFFLLLGVRGMLQCGWRGTGDHVLAVLLSCAVSVSYGVIYFFAAESESNSFLKIRWMHLLAFGLDAVCLFVSFIVSDSSTLILVVFVSLLVVTLQALRAFNIWNFIFTETNDEFVPTVEENEKSSVAEVKAPKAVRFRQPSTVFDVDINKISHKML